MATNTDGGTTASLSNTPQAKDDYYYATEGLVRYFDVMLNDLGGSAKLLWSIDNTSDDGATDLVCKDVAGVCEYSELGAKISLTSDGKIRYDSGPSSALNSLPAGVKAYDQFTYAIRLSNGTLSWATVTVEITGVNDAAIITGDDQGEISEDADPNTTSGTLVVNDVDTGENELQPIAEGTAGDNGYGTFEVLANGQWTYTLDNGHPDVQALAEGEVVYDTITVTSEDGTDTAVVTVAITGTNDGPVANADSGTTSENAVLTIDVLANDTDVDNDHVLTVTAASSPAGEGTASVVANQVRFDPGTDFDYLAVGESTTVTISYTIQDEHGASSSSTVEITVTGTNDTPAAIADSASVGEDSSTSGNVGTNDTDADNGALLSYALNDPGSAPAGLTFNPDGSWTFDASSYDSLDQGEELVLVVPYTVTDEHGASSSADLTITVTGTNDTPVAVPDEASVDEDGNTSGNVGTNDTDADAGASLSYALNDAGSAPTGLTFNPDGSWTFDASSYDSLDEGEELVLVVPYTVTDEHGASSSADLTITVTGTNDTPVAVADEASVDEDGNTSGNVGANDIDADAGASLSYALNDPGSAPTGLTFNPDGSWTLDASSYDSLDDGEELVLVVPYTVTDEHGASSSADLTITVTGTNDTPVAVADEASVDEDGNTSGNVGTNDTDADAGASLSCALNDAGSAPTGLTFNPDGSWTFDASSYDSLDEGEELVLVVPYTVTDEHGASSSADLTITVTGTNDTPLANADEANVDEDGNTSGNVGANDTDADAGASLSYALNDPGSAPAGLVFNSDGSWTFDASSYDSLDEGEELVLVVPYTVTDEHGASSSADLTITVTGTNDTPVAAADETSVNEDGNTSGNVGTNDTDADAGASLSYALNDPGSAPTGLTFNPDGSWTFDALSYDSLDQGEELVLVVPYTVTDEHGASSSADLTITVTGTNDTPVANADEASVDEDGNTNGNVGSNDTDADANASLSYALNDPGSAPTGLTFNPDGSWTFDASSYDSLDDGQELVLVVPYTVTDEHGASSSADLTITVTGTNDTPVAVADEASVDEDGNTSGNVGSNDTDADAGASLSYALNDPGSAPVGLVFNPAGSWTFDASSYDSLDQGEELVLVVPYTVTDENGASSSADLTITVTGTNDTPVAVADEASVDEDGNTSGNVGANDTDSDAGASLSYALNDPGSAPAGLVFNPDGSWTFDASNYDSLNQGEELVLVVPYTVTDEHGASSSADLTITITGTNDLPVAIADSGSVNEDASTSGNVGGNDTDADSGASLAYALNDPGSAPPGLTFNPDGSWTFDASSYYSLNQAEPLVLVVPYTVTDQHGASSSANLTIAVTGTNDTPVAIADAGSVNEDANTSGNVGTNDTDADSAASLSYALNDPGSAPTGLTFNPDGSWSFDASSYDSLEEGEPLVLVVPYTVTDQHGASSSANLTITITGVSDGVTPPPTETGADPNDFDTLVGINAVNHNTSIVGSNSGGDNITGDGGDQDINGRGGNDTIYGAGGDDDIDGGADNDTLYGQAGADDIQGNNGFDSVYGGSGDDELIGGNEADTLYGGSDNDTIVGNNGDDVLIGGYGADTLTGGGDNDTFRYLSTLDTNDTIVDFMGSGNDQIDMSAIDANPGGANDPFAWGGTTATAHALWFSYDAGTNTTTLYGDTDGDTSTAEFMLTLQNYNGFNPFNSPLTPPTDISL